MNRIGRIRRRRSITTFVRTFERCWSQKAAKDRHFYRDIEDDIFESETRGKMISQIDGKKQPKIHDITFGQLNHQLTSQKTYKNLLEKYLGSIFLLKNYFGTLDIYFL